MKKIEQIVFLEYFSGMKQNFPFNGKKRLTTFFHPHELNPESRKYKNIICRNYDDLNELLEYGGWKVKSVHPLTSTAESKLTVLFVLEKEIYTEEMVEEKEILL